MSTSPTTVKPPRPQRWIRHISRHGLNRHSSIPTYILTDMPAADLTQEITEDANADAGYERYSPADVKARYVKAPLTDWLRTEIDRASQAVVDAQGYLRALLVARGNRP